MVKKKINNTSIGSKIADALIATFMVTLCITTIYPYLNQIAISFNDGADTMFGGITIFPRKFTFINYQTILGNSDFISAISLSVSRVITGVILGLFVTTAAAYALVKKDLPFRKQLLLFLIIPTYIHAGLIPTFMLFRTLSLINNYLVYILPTTFLFFNMVILRTFFQAIPESLEESAVLDGANEFIVFYKIILPLSMPVLATVALWMSVTHWNDWTTTLYYVTSKQLRPLQFLLMQVVKESETVQKMAAEMSMGNGDVSMIKPTPEAVKSATLIVSTLPIIATYPFLQKYFVKGVVIGAVKE